MSIPESIIGKESGITHISMRLGLELGLMPTRTNDSYLDDIGFC
jgi:hypothetical protein